MHTNKNRILVVDDEPDIVDTLKYFLSVKGYEVSGALSGEEAFGFLEHKKTDLVLLDIKMPGIKGSEVARIIKDKYPEIKIIILTAYSGELENLSQKNLIEAAFIKPIGLQELNNKLVELFSQRDLQTINLKSKQGINARVLLLKARLLFVEPSGKIYDFLSAHFRQLSNKGENYELDFVDSKENLEEKIMLFKPDILAVNAASLRGSGMNLDTKMLGCDLSCKEIILYNIESLQNLHKTELERLTKSIETVCLRNGLIEIKWVEI